MKLHSMANQGSCLLARQAALGDGRLHYAQHQLCCEVKGTHSQYDVAAWGAFVLNRMVTVAGGVHL